MRLLVVGANGLLGSNVVHAGRQRDWSVNGTYHSSRPSFDVPLSQFDLREFQRFSEIINRHDPDIVIDCAAMTDVDTCESNPDEAFTINGDAPAKIANQCKTNGVDFVHVSTDYVFDGTARTPYDESDELNAIQTYGKSKRLGERGVLEVLGTALIPRLSFVWGIHRSTGDLSGFPAWVNSQLRSKNTAPLFTDQWVTPTRAGQAAETILDLIEQSVDGITHIACTSCATPFDFGEVIAEQVNGSSDLLLEGSMNDIDRDARRPTYSCLDVSKVESALGRSQPTLREDVKTVWEDLD